MLEIVQKSNMPQKLNSTENEGQLNPSKLQPYALTCSGHASEQTALPWLKQGLTVSHNGLCAGSVVPRVGSIDMVESARGRDPWKVVRSFCI